MYDDLKDFCGQAYTGMRVGGEHGWLYPDGRWRERKVAPDRWEFTFASTKRRERSAPEGSGVPVGTQYHWYLLKPDDRLELRFDWLSGEDPAAFAGRTFDAASASLSSQYGSTDPSSWREPAALQHYQRLNADLFADLGLTTAKMDASRDSGLPGDVPDHIRMDRGTYNHVVVYQTKPVHGGPLGQGVSKAGSVIPPGQSGHVSLAGAEAPHYEDQLELYVEWRYKPMPLTFPEARALAESERVLLR